MDAFDKLMLLLDFLRSSRPLQVAQCLRPIVKMLMSRKSGRRVSIPSDRLPTIKGDYLIAGMQFDCKCGLSSLSGLKENV